MKRTKKRFMHNGRTTEHGKRQIRHLARYRSGRLTIEEIRKRIPRSVPGHVAGRIVQAERERLRRR